MAVESKKAQMLVIFGAIAIIFISVVATLLVMRPAKPAKQNVHQNVTFTDAMLSCKTSISKEYERDLVNVHIDNHSSHFDEANFRYKLFFHLDLRDKKNVRAHYVNCFVRAASGNISEFTVLERLPSDGSLVPKRRFDSIKWPK